MPKNNDLQPVKLPMEVRFGEKPTTKFINNLDAINVQLIHAPTMAELRSYLPPFLEATWAENPMDATRLPIEEKDRLIRECLEGKALPGALETVNLVFKIEGISLQEVTHILRHRTATFSADCSGDKWWTHKDALVPNSIENSTSFNQWEVDKDERGIDHERPVKGNFYARYKQIVEMAKELYCDMIDSKQISIMDARYILPRCLSTFYFMRIGLKDLIGFIKQRIDKQIQPETDNLIAYYMYLELLKQYPIMNGLIDIHQPSYFFIKMARTGKATNLYFPDADSDKFEWNENDFIYQKYRSEMNGTDPDAKNKFEDYIAWVDEAIAAQEKLNRERLDLEYAYFRGELDLQEDDGQ